MAARSPPNGETGNNRMILETSRLLFVVFLFFAVFIIFLKTWAPLAQPQPRNPGTSQPPELYRLSFR